MAPLTDDKHDGIEHDRRFFHSFPRPKQGESDGAVFERGLEILAFMKEVGLVLAPEIVEWDVSVVSGRPELHHVFQRRACFTELTVPKLSEHTKKFGPISLSFSHIALRNAGAMPVIYVPQGSNAIGLNQIGTFCMRAAHHTLAVLGTLETLRKNSDPKLLASSTGKTVSSNCTITLNNTEPSGAVVASYNVAMEHVRHVLQHVSFNNIPFDHSIGMLNVFQNMFYPTDNTHTGGDILDYYRQREWRLIAGDIIFGDQSMRGRSLTPCEVTRLEKIDNLFWTHNLQVNGEAKSRAALALVYAPVQNWNFFDLVQEIFVPNGRVDAIRKIVGDKIKVTENCRPQCA